MTSWKIVFHSIPSVESKADSFNPPSPWPTEREVYFILTPLRIRHDQGRIGIPVLTVCRDMKKNGTRTVPLRRPIAPRMIATIQNETDRQLLSEMASNSDLYCYGSNDCSKVLLSPTKYAHFLPLLCATKRCFVEPVQHRYHLHTVENSPPLEIDEGPPWSLAIQWEKQGKNLMGKANITRDNEITKIEEIQAIYPGDESNPGILIHRDLMCYYSFEPALFSWIQFFMRRGHLKVPQSKWDTIVRGRGRGWHRR